MGKNPSIYLNPVTILRLISFNSNSNLLLYKKEEKRNKGGEKRMYSKGTRLNMRMVEKGHNKLN